MPPKLTGLELQGYKTFANKNVFEFSKNITAIVGPNGSGKSNVADAIRWVLGEQSFSLLRARKTEDMIFSGSERRPRAGMASATITFDNETEWLPIDYSEVSITRRAYRDGQNEYLLNGTRVRLRDINELLAQSGLAERTYTVIGQGLVDSALSLRPEERRGFFEEAAGIQLYRRRQGEATNRLQTTRRNMARVYDILNEIKPRLRSLERQAKKVEEAERITADLQLLLREWYGYHWHSSQEEIQIANEILQTRNQVLAQARRNQSAIEKKLRDVRDKIHSLRNQLSGWHGESSDLHRIRESESKEAAVLEERKKSMYQQEAELTRQLGILQETLQLNQDRAVTLAKELEEKLAELHETQEKSNAAHSKLTERILQRSQQEKILQDKREELFQIDALALQSQAKKSESTQRIGELELAIEENSEKIKTDEALLQQELDRLDDITGQRDRILQKRSELEQMKAEQTERVAKHREEGSELQQTRSELQVECTSSEASLRYLEDAESSFAGLSQSSATLLQNSRKGRFSGELSALSQYLEVPEPYERAVASFLGEKIHTVLLDDTANLDDVLKYLMSGSIGRTVLATAKKASSTQKPPLDQPGVIGAVSELVSYPNKFADIFHTLFNDVLLVENRSSAQVLAANGYSYPLVTLQGEIFYPDGIIIAGTENAKSGIISRPREKRELQEKIQRIKLEEEKIAAELRVIEQKRKASQKILHELDIDYQQQSVLLTSIEREIFQQNLSVERLQTGVDEMQERILGSRKRIESSLESIEEIEKKLKDLASQRQNAQKTIQETEALLHNLPVDDFQTDVNHWETRLAVLHQAVEGQKQRVQEAQSRTQTTREQLHAVKERLRKHAEEFASLQQHQETLSAQEQEIVGKIDAITSKIQPAEEQLTGLEETLVTLQDDFTDVQQALTVADRNATQAKLNLTREREKLEALREKIEDDIGLVAFEYEQQISGQETLPLEGFVKQLPKVAELSEGLNSEIKRNRGMLRRLGSINPEAKNEYDEVFERHEFLTQQLADLNEAEEDLQEVISELNELMKIEFNKTFKAVADEFRVFFTRLFNGGSARLVLTDEENPNEAGIEIHAKLPGRREQSLALLSGGERSLTAVALVFSLLKVSPTPFCILDEVDAMLDESNVGRFCDLLKEIGQLGTQFIIITHNRGTVQSADIIYGVTKGTDSASHVVSLKLDEVSDDMVYA